jgi:type III secretion system low calcium response chaperone LcrH/SycD
MPKKKPVDVSSINFTKLMASLGNITYLIGDHIKDTLRAAYEGAKKGIAPKQAVNLSEQSIESIYAKAYAFYNQGKYKEANFVFQALMLLDPTQPKHVLGCAACLHRMEFYDKAAELYLLCSSLDPENPLPHFHASDCYIKLKNPDLAAFELKNTIECAKDKSEFAIIKERALMTLETVQAEIAARGGKEEVDTGQSEPIS